MQKGGFFPMSRSLQFLVTVVLVLPALRCASALDGCVTKKDLPCVVREARIELYRSPHCCDCAFQLGLAERELAFREHQWDDVPGLTSALSTAEEDLKRRAACKPKRREYVSAFLETEQRTRDIVEDREPSVWTVVDAITDGDARIASVLAHQRLFATFCKHDVEGELNRYVGTLRSMRSDAIRGRLATLRGTSVEAEARAIFHDAFFSDLAALNDVETWERSREEFQDTRYYALVDGEIQRALRARIELLTQPDEIEAYCHRFTSDEDRQNCAGRVQRALVSKIESLESAEAVEVLCPRLADRSDQEMCVIRFRQTAVGAAESNPGPGTFAIARRACHGAECWRRVMELTFSFEVRNAYQRLSRSGVRGGPQTMGRSCDVWRQFIAALDTVAERLFGGGASLKSMEPSTYADAVRRMDDARQESLAMTRAVGSSWAVLLNDINTIWKPNLIFRSKWIPQIDGELRDLVTAIQLDSTNPHAHQLILQIMRKRQQLDDRGDVQLKVAKVAFDIALGELTGYIGSRMGRIAVSVAYQALGF
jgi:hypothetical protein